LLSKRNIALGITSYFPQGAAHGAQTSIKAKLQSPEKWRQVDLCVAQVFYNYCIPFNFVNSIYNQEIIDAIASIGFGIKVLVMMF